MHPAFRHVIEGLWLGLVRPDIIPLPAVWIGAEHAREMIWIAIGRRVGNFRPYAGTGTEASAGLHPNPIPNLTPL